MKTKEILEYRGLRKKFYDRLDFWADVDKKEYGTYDIHPIASQEVDKIRKAANRVGAIFFKIATLLRKVSDQTLLDLGFPAEVLKFLRFNPLEIETIISRLDLVRLNEDGVRYVALELNADTPTFIKELFHVNGKLCQEFRLQDPNAGEEKKLGLAVNNAIVQTSKALGVEDPYVVFTAHKENEEDSGTSKYLMNLSNFPAKFVPLEDLLIVKGEGLYDKDGNRIDILYRQTFPVECWLLDRDEDGDNLGEMLIELVDEGKLGIINPPSAFLLQSKAVQAVIWGLHEEESDFFTKEEHSWIQEHFLPTYLEADVFLESNERFVKKPAFGREGDTVEIYDGRTKILEDKQKSYTDYLPVFQKCVDLPTTEFMTEEGLKEGHLMVGCFLLNGEASAFGYRIGNKITDNLSYFLAAGIR